MTLYISNRDGNGKTSEEGHYKFQTTVWSGSILGNDSLQVIESSPPGMSVTVLPGQFKVDTLNNYAYTGWSTSNEQISITTPDTANPRMDSIVVYVDKAAATSPSPPNNPNIAKIIAVNGVPSALPTPPNSTTIQSAVGASNPYIVIANVLVDTADTQITNDRIIDVREFVNLGDSLVSTSSIVNNSVTTSKLATGSVTQSILSNNSVITSKIANGAVTTSKFRPTIINSNFLPAGTRWNTSSNGYFLVPNCSFTYTAGSTNETLVLWTGFMAMKSAGNAEIFLYVNGSAYGICAYVDAGSPWYRGEFLNFVDVNAGQTVTLAVYAYNNGAGLSVINEVSRWMPTIRGFSIYRP